MVISKSYVRVAVELQYWQEKSFHYFFIEQILLFLLKGKDLW